ncbi:MAG: AAA family ATPase [Actinomycetota bacterium]|nr:AAA family ATPase [Actinomycetota bacterium]
MIDAVLGREKELHVVGRFLDVLKDGGPAACVLEGEAGIGKTVLLREGVGSSQAASFRVLACAPAESETALSYSSLADLLAGVEPRVLAALAAPQRNALEVALLRVTPGDAAAGQRAIATAVVCVLAELAAATPLVIAIDDVQWLDRPSARVLEFAARRLGGSRVGFLLSLRTPAGGSVPLTLDRALPEGRLLRIRVGELSAGALHQLIKARLGSTFSRAALLAIHRATGGNAFYALELAASLLRDGMPAAGEAFPVPDDVRDLVTDRLRGLPGTTRELLLFAAATSAPTVPELQSAVTASARQMRVRLAGGEAAGVIVVEGDAIRFKHPLFASAISAAASAEERRRAHRRLAALAPNAEQRSLHLALCTEGPDVAIAHTVAGAARDVRRRGAPDAAAELAGLALRLTPADDSDERDRRALELAYYLTEAGDADRARAVVLDVAERPGRLKARALLDLAGLDYWGDGSGPAVERCEQALAAASGERALEAACHAELAVYCDFDSARCERHALAALALLDADGDGADPDALIDALLATTRASLLSGRGIPSELIERAFECESRATQSIHRSRVGAQLGQWLKYVDDFDGSRARLAEALSEAVQEGDESSLPNLLMHLAQVECWSGNWPLALRYSDESVELAEQVGQSSAGPPAMRALVDAHLGNVERARETIAARIQEVEGKPTAIPLYLRALGFLELSLGNAAEAERHLSRAVETADALGIREPAVYRIHADLIEALIASGRPGRAEGVLGELEARARASPVPWSLAAGARCRGLLLAASGELEAAGHAYDEALRRHEASPMPFERARTLLVRGLLQRRKNERRLAHASLEQALALFAELGAPLWAARAQRELRPLGGRPTSREVLTPSEQRVAELAARGLTNRQVASALFISPKTVESNLARAYRKLEIRSRAELGARIAAESAAPPDTPA